MMFTESPHPLVFNLLILGFIVLLVFGLYGIYKSLIDFKAAILYKSLPPVPLTGWERPITYEWTLILSKARKFEQKDEALAARALVSLSSVCTYAVKEYRGGYIVVAYKEGCKLYDDGSVGFLL